jgi:hypothetical protein
MAAARLCLPPSSGVDLEKQYMTGLLEHIFMPWQ